MSETQSSAAGAARFTLRCNSEVQHVGNVGNAAANGSHAFSLYEGTAGYSTAPPMKVRLNATVERAQPRRGMPAVEMARQRQATVYKRRAENGR